MEFPRFCKQNAQIATRGLPQRGCSESVHARTLCTDSLTALEECELLPRGAKQRRMAPRCMVALVVALVTAADAGEAQEYRSDAWCAAHHLGDHPSQCVQHAGCCYDGISSTCHSCAEHSHEWCKANGATLKDCIKLSGCGFVVTTSRALVRLTVRCKEAVSQTPHHNIFVLPSSRNLATTQHADSTRSRARASPASSTKCVTHARPPLKQPPPLPPFVPAHVERVRRAHVWKSIVS